MSGKHPCPGLRSGVWSYPCSTFAGQDDVMWIDVTRQRIITFVVIKINPVRRAQMRIWYQPESPTSIRAGLKPREVERMHEFRLEDDVLVWMHPGNEQAWRRLFSDAYPEWLEAEVAAANAKMDEVEESA